MTHPTFDQQIITIFIYRTFQGLLQPTAHHNETTGSAWSKNQWMSNVCGPPQVVEAMLTLCRWPREVALSDTTWDTRVVVLAMVLLAAGCCARCFFAATSSVGADDLDVVVVVVDDDNDDYVDAAIFSEIHHTYIVVPLTTDFPLLHSKHTLQDTLHSRPFTILITILNTSSPTNLST